MSYLSSLIEGHASYGEKFDLFWHFLALFWLVVGTLDIGWKEGVLSLWRLLCIVIKVGEWWETTSMFEYKKSTTHHPESYIELGYASNWIMHHIGHQTECHCASNWVTHNIGTWNKFVANGGGPTHQSLSTKWSPCIKLDHASNWSTKWHTFLVRSTQDRKEDMASQL